MYCKVYTLADPVTGEVRYIGQTTSNLKRRLQGHLVCARQGKKTHLYNWIRSLNSEPIIELLDEGERNMLEQYWISQFKCWGFNLVNQTEGGDGGLGRKMSELEKEKRSRSMKNFYSENSRSKETSFKLGESNKRIYIVIKDDMTIEFKGRIAAANYIGCNPHSVSDVVTGRRNSVYNYKILLK